MYRLNKVNIIQDDIIIEKKPSWIGTKLTLIKETILKNTEDIKNRISIKVDNIYTNLYNTFANFTFEDFKYYSKQFFEKTWAIFALGVRLAYVSIPFICCALLAFYLITQLVVLVGHFDFEISHTINNIFPHLDKLPYPFRQLDKFNFFYSLGKVFLWFHILTLFTWGMGASLENVNRNNISSYIMVAITVGFVLTWLLDEVYVKLVYFSYVIPIITMIFTPVTKSVSQPDMIIHIYKN